MLDRSESALRIVLRSRFYRSAFLALLIAGIGLSAATPQLTLFLVRDLGTPLPVAGLYYVTNLAAPVAGYLVGRWSDRTQDRLFWFRVCTVIGTVGWLAMAAANSVADSPTARPSAETARLSEPSSAACSRSLLLRVRPSTRRTSPSIHWTRRRCWLAA